MFVQIYRYKCLSSAEPTHTAVDLSSQRSGDAASHTDTSELVKHARKTPFFCTRNDAKAEGQCS